MIEKIAKRDLSKLGKLVKFNRPNLDIAIDDKDIEAMCKDHYIPIQGARGITGYIKSTIKPAIAKTLLFDDSAEGVIKISYDSETKKVTVNPAAAASQPEGREIPRPSAEANKQFGNMPI